MPQNKIILEAKIELQEETAFLKEQASKVIELPKENERQPDLQYFSAIFVSTGTNLNNAHFLGSELVAAEGTIINKALDVEHSETDIIGSIIGREFTDKDGNKLNIKELSAKEKASLDDQEMHIAISAILYKNRFPNIAKEVSDGGWKVSMECYYQSFDVKIGDLILSHKEAESLGLASIADKIIGKAAKVIKKGKEIAEGNVSRVLRGICFSGCGIVKNPANPPSIIMETAKEKKLELITDENDVFIIDYDKLQSNEDDNNLTSQKVDTSNEKEEARDGTLDDSTGICVNYKKRLLDKEGNVTKENWCSAYETSCASFSRDTTDPDCLRNQNIRRFARASFQKRAAEKEANDRRKELLDGLKAALREAVKT